MNVCTGSPKLLKSISRQNFLGHRIQCCDIDGGQLFFCVVCGAWALRKCVNLAQPCAGFCQYGSAGEQALKHIRSGMRPDAAERTLSEPQRHHALERDEVQDAPQQPLFQPLQGSLLESVFSRVRERRIAKQC